MNVTHTFLFLFRNYASLIMCKPELYFMIQCLIRVYIHSPVDVAEPASDNDGSELL